MLQEWHEDRLASPLPRIVVGGVALGEPPPGQTPEGVQVLVGEDGRTIALIADEAVIDGKPYLKGSQVELSDTSMDQSGRCWWPYFCEGLFKGLLLDRGTFVLFYQLQETLRLKAVFAEEARSFVKAAEVKAIENFYQEGIVKLLECCPFRWPEPELRPGKKSVSCAGVSLGMCHNYFEESEAVELLFSPESERVLAVAGPSLVIDGEEVRAGDYFGESALQWGFQSLDLRKEVGFYRVIFVFEDFYLWTRITKSGLRVEFALLGPNYEQYDDSELNAEMARRTENFSRDVERRFAPENFYGE